MTALLLIHVERLYIFADKWLYIYQTHNGNFILYNRMLAHDVGWSVLDIAFSPDGKHFAYSSWADCCKWHRDYSLCFSSCSGKSCTICITSLLFFFFTVYQCQISGGSLETLPLTPGVRRFCVFSVAFSNDGTEILGGANDQCLYIYDLECQQRILRVCTIIIRQWKLAYYSLHWCSILFLQFEGHDEDVNSVAFADDSSQIFYSASDDGLCKV